MTQRDCFVCNPVRALPAEAPFEWSSARTLCREHRRSLELEDGHELDVILARAKPHDSDLDGSLLGWIYNPVFIEVAAGRIKGWTDWVAGGLAVFEDRFAAGSYFEFRSLEGDAAVDLLHAVRMASADGIVLKTRADLLSMAVKSEVTVRQHFPRLGQRRGPVAGLSGLFGFWNFEFRLAQTRSRVKRRWPESWEELESWSEECFLANDQFELEPGTEAGFVRALSQLASRRFGA